MFRTEIGVKISQKTFELRKCRKERKALFDEYGEMVTLKDVCDMLGIGVNTAYRLVREQKIKAIKIGSIWRIPKQAVLEYIFFESGMTRNLYI